MEAQSTLYQRPLTFASQAKLFAWIDRSRSWNLKRVKTLTLRLTDVDLSPLLDPEQRHTRTSVWGLYQQELERLDHAMEVLPGIELLTISPPGPSHSHLLRGVYLSFLGLIQVRCQKLQLLVLEDDEAVADRVPTLRSIGSIGYIWPARRTDITPSAKSSSPAGGDERADAKLASGPTKSVHTAETQPRKRTGYSKPTEARIERVADSKAKVRVSKRVGRPRRVIGCRGRE
ncbi:hypothetical protein B0A55_01501 [Friedmanniomyces simplex]|uniref:Uncharacterized protein n=1 Tax=Friedmanniomyces simplex TaxID=329884 RepID=A0A4U0Y144_9PEZI|nr:hypothetical protein B0A55_01501 [Friedmanniomyces simplex]